MQKRKKWREGKGMEKKMRGKKLDSKEKEKNKTKQKKYRSWTLRN